MDVREVRDHFEEEALEYDKAILRIVPLYHEQHEIILRILLALFPFHYIQRDKTLALSKRRPRVRRL
ncbi:MAG: hypothetical protein ACM3TN_26895 [Alphaproteobacteria bacterium]